MKKRFPAPTLLLTLLLCVSVRAAGPGLEVRLPAAPVEAGEEFTVTVDLTGNPGVHAIQFALAFDRDLMECVDAELGDVTAQSDIHVANPDAPSGAVVAAASIEPMTGDGTAGIFRFKAKENLSDFHFSMEKVVISDRDGNKLDVTVSVGGSGESQSGSASNSGATNDGSASNDSKPADNGATSNGSGATNSGGIRGSGAFGGGKPADGGATSDESKPADGGATSNESKPADNGAASNESKPADNGAASNDNGATSNESKPADAESAAPPFTDIAGTWAEDYIRTAAERNLFQDYADGTFRPDNRLTRAQFMMVLWNLAGRPAPEKESPFRDMSAQSQNFRDAVSWAYAKGYVNGTSAETFSPGEPITRQAAMKILFSYNGSRRGAEALLTAVYDERYTDSGLISSWAKNAVYWAVYQTILSGNTPTTLNPGGSVTRAQLAAVMARYTDRFPVS